MIEFAPDAKWLALEIERRYPPERWAERIALLPDDKREDAAEYLRGMYRRILRARRAPPDVAAAALQEIRKMESDSP